MTMSELSTTSFTTPQVNLAAMAMKNKLMKYREFINGRLQMVSLLLDLKPDKAQFNPENLLDVKIRQILRCDFVMYDCDLAKTEVVYVEQRYLAQMIGASESSNNATSSDDELARFVEMTRRPDPS